MKNQVLEARGFLSSESSPGAKDNAKTLMKGLVFEIDRTDVPSRKELQWCQLVLAVHKWFALCCASHSWTLTTFDSHMKACPVHNLNTIIDLQPRKFKQVLSFSLFNSVYVLTCFRADLYLVFLFFFDKTPQGSTLMEGKIYFGSVSGAAVHSPYGRKGEEPPQSMAAQACNGDVLMLVGQEAGSTSRTGSRYNIEGSPLVTCSHYPGPLPVGSPAFKSAPQTGNQICKTQVYGGTFSIQTITFCLYVPWREKPLKASNHNVYRLRREWIGGMWFR